MPALRLALLLALSCALPAQAQIYKWVDANGQQHFSTHPPVAEQGLNPLKLHHGYESDGLPPSPPSSSPVATATDDAEQKPTAPTSEREMCSEAVRWTQKEDLPNLKEITDARLKEGKIDREHYKKALKALDAIQAHVSMSNCLISKGKDREIFECLSQGSGVAICTGAMAEAFNRAWQEVQKRNGN